MKMPAVAEALRAAVAQATRLDDDPVLVLAVDDPALAGLQLERQGPGRAILVDGTTRSRILVAGEGRRARDGALALDVVVDGWRVEVELEPARRALLRDQARRGRADAGALGPLQIRAVIPGRIVAVSVTRGDALESGQQVLVLEAMKMQNEVRAPRSGTVEQITAVVGQNVEVGDLLVVIT
jgi:biotin carboxyl carrier protein